MRDWNPIIWALAVVGIVLIILLVADVI